MTQTAKKLFVPKLKDKSLNLSEYISARWRIQPDYSHILEDMYEPAYWANVSKKLKPANIIEVEFEDMSAYAELFVLDAGDNWAHVTLLNYWAFDHAMQDSEEKRGQHPALEKYKIEFYGSKLKFCVERKSDNERIKTGFASRESALEWADKHVTSG